MRFEKIIIKNFKGIEHVEIDFSPSGANIFTLIGLNESGKTTILEAISTFKIGKDETGALYGSDIPSVSPSAYVLKRYKSNFTGDISIKAKTRFESGEKQRLVDKIFETTGCRMLIESIGDTFEMTRNHAFENSDFKQKSFLLNFFPEAILKGKRKAVRLDEKSSIWIEATQLIINSLPEIIYFPTFIFNQPDKIILNPVNSEKTVNKLYRQIISNIASSLKNPLDLKQHLIDRITGDGKSSSGFFSHFMMGSDKQQQIEAVLNEMSAHVTHTVFNSWTKIFGGDFSGREIVLKIGVEDNEGSQEVYIQFAIKDRNSTYDISERSLGFRWFFSFLLFTFYRTSITNRPTFFLLDEPASNLHAKAQMQLLDNLSKIAVNGSMILYSTHSHYLINPEWLDQAYIVSNKAVDYENVVGQNDFASDGQTLIDAKKYRTFVGMNPDKVTYFQPVMDKLEVIPSRLDLACKSILVEGKGDFLVLEYGRRILLNSKSDVKIVPTRGATGMDELIGLFMGWGIPFIICLDDDKEGRIAKKKYQEEWGIELDKVNTLLDVSPELLGKEISGFLEVEDINLIKDYFNISTQPKKGQIQLFFSENLAKKKKHSLSKKFVERVQAFEVFLKAKFD